VSFRELVLAEIWKEILCSLSKQQPDKKCLTVSVPAEQLNYAIGYNASNKNMLLQHFQNVKFIADPLLKERNFHADYC
jgi:hypothetical protein